MPGPVTVFAPREGKGSMTQFVEELMLLATNASNASHPDTSRSAPPEDNSNSWGQVLCVAFLVAWFMFACLCCWDPGFNNTCNDE